MSRKRHLWAIVAAAAGITISSVVAGSDVAHIPGRIFYNATGYFTFWLLWARNI